MDQNNSISALQRQNGVIAHHGIISAIVTDNNEAKMTIKINFLNDEWKAEVQKTLYQLIRSKNIRLLKNQENANKYLKKYMTSEEIDQKILELQKQIEGIDAEISKYTEEIIESHNKQIQAEIDELNSGIANLSDQIKSESSKDLRISLSKEQGEAIEKRNNLSMKLNPHLNLQSKKYYIKQEIEILNKKISHDDLKNSLTIDSNGNLTLNKEYIRDESLQPLALMRELVFSQDGNVTKLFQSIITSIEKEYGLPSKNTTNSTTSHGTFTYNSSTSLTNERYQAKQDV